MSSLFSLAMLVLLCWYHLPLSLSMFLVLLPFWNQRNRRKGYVRVLFCSCLSQRTHFLPNCNSKVWLEGFQWVTEDQKGFGKHDRNQVCVWNWGNSWALCRCVFHVMVRNLILFYLYLEFKTTRQRMFESYLKVRGSDSRVRNWWFVARMLRRTLYVIHGGCTSQRRFSCTWSSPIRLLRLSVLIFYC